MTEFQKRKTAKFLGATSDYQSTCAGGRLRRDGEVCAHLSGVLRHVAAPTAQPMEGPVAGALGPLPTKDLGGESNRAYTHFRSSRALRGWRTGSRWQSGATRDEEPGDHMLLGHDGADTTTETWHKVI